MMGLFITRAVIPANWIIVPVVDEFMWRLLADSVGVKLWLDSIIDKSSSAVLGDDVIVETLSGLLMITVVACDGILVRKVLLVQGVSFS